MDRTNWTVNVSSEINEGNGNGYKNTITDGNISSYWHSSWGDGAEKTMPHWISIEMPQAEDLKSLVFIPRQGTETGFPTACTILLSQNPMLTENTRAAVNALLAEVEAGNKSEITKVDGIFNYANYTQGEYVAFSLGSSAVNAQYVLFVYKHTLSNNNQDPDQFACCSELYLSTSDEPVASSNEAARQAARASLKSKIDKYSVGTTFGYAAQSVYDNAVSVYNNTSATEAEYVAAMNSLQPIMPEDGKYFRIVSAYDQFESKQSVKKAIYADGINTGWKSLDASDAAQLWVLEKNASNEYVLKSIFTGKYLVNESGNPKLTADDKEAAGKVDFVVPNSPVFNIRVGNSGPFHCGGHSSGDGVNGNLIFYGGFGSEVNSASAWYLEEATDIEPISITESLEYTEGDKVFGYYTEASVNALKENIINNNLTFDEAIAAAQTTLERVTPNPDKFYRLTTKSSRTLALGVNGGELRTLSINTDIQLRGDALWQIKASGVPQKYA